MVRTSAAHSFVIADLPGLIEGASEGAGLGHLFLRHLSRTRLLLHIVDVSTVDLDVDPIEAALEQIQVITAELNLYSEELGDKPRWLALNKLDMVDDPEGLRNELIKRLDWKAPIYGISALTGLGTEDLVRDMQNWLDEQRRLQQEAEAKAAGTFVEPDPRFDEKRQNVDTPPPSGTND